jgi:hypothetical protein
MRFVNGLYAKPEIPGPGTPAVAGGAIVEKTLVVPVAVSNLSTVLLKKPPTKTISPKVGTVVHAHSAAKRVALANLAMLLIMKFIPMPNML